MSSDYLLKEYVESVAANGLNWLRSQSSHPSNANENDAYYNQAFECMYIMTEGVWKPLGVENKPIQIDFDFGK